MLSKNWSPPLSNQKRFATVRVPTKKEKCFSQWDVNIPTDMPGILSLLEPIAEHFITLHTHLKIQKRLPKKPTSDIPYARGRLSPNGMLNYTFR